MPISVSHMLMGKTITAGNPLAKAYISAFERNILTSAFPDAQHILEQHAQCTYWISSRSRINSQFVCLGQARATIGSKVFNYGRIYGAGLKFAVQLLLQGNPEMTREVAEEKAEMLYKSTKGQRYRNPRTPVLGCQIPDALMPLNVNQKDEHVDLACLAMHISNLWARSMFASRLGLYDLPLNVAFFSLVDIDHCLRKEVDMSCITPSHRSPIPPGKSLTIHETIERLATMLSKENPYGDEVESVTQMVDKTSKKRWMGSFASHALT
ncbi:hypothetical protein BASA81_015284 [Batrachochytrium salamandrivorans]|nr:hypothetical protein BASA81_015284 [Batrachochytrium salamandrivorans]